MVLPRVGVPFYDTLSGGWAERRRSAVCPTVDGVPDMGEAVGQRSVTMAVVGIHKPRRSAFRAVSALVVTSYRSPTAPGMRASSRAGW